jgi:hypothetical protein
VVEIVDTRSFFYNKQLYILSNCFTKQAFKEGCITRWSLDQITTGKVAVTNMNSPAESSCCAGGEDSWMEGPRLAAVKVGSSKPLLETTLCDRRIWWTLVTGGTRRGLESNPGGRQVHQVSTRGRCVVLNL